MKPTVGRIVEYILIDRYGNKQVRPAMVVQVWSDDLLNLQVFTDGTNDGPEYAQGIYWATSVHRSETKEERTWDWMDYQKEQALKTAQSDDEVTTADLAEMEAKFDFSLAWTLLTEGETVKPVDSQYGYKLDSYETPCGNKTKMLAIVNDGKVLSYTSLNTEQMLGKWMVVK